MSYLKERIKKDGVVINESVLKVDSFLNHQIDPVVISEITKEFYDYFHDRGVTKVFTIEASGIAPALQIAGALKVPMLFAKKSKPSTQARDEQYVTAVHSYTKNVTNDVIVSKKYLNSDDRVLIVDDFLATGEAALGLVDLVHQAGAKVVGVGICVEKAFQDGRQKLEEAGMDVYSITRVASLANNEVTFLDDEEVSQEA